MTNQICVQQGEHYTVSLNILYFICLYLSLIKGPLTIKINVPFIKLKYKNIVSAT